MSDRIRQASDGVVTSMISLLEAWTEGWGSASQVPSSQISDLIESAIRQEVRAAKDEMAPGLARKFIEASGGTSCFGDDHYAAAQAIRDLLESKHDCQGDRTSGVVHIIRQEVEAAIKESTYLLGEYKLIRNSLHSTLDALRRHADALANHLDDYEESDVLDAYRAAFPTSEVT